MSDSLFLLGLVALTSALVGVVAQRWGRLDAKALPTAAARLLEAVGLALAFYALNLAAGFGAVLVLRKITGAFVSAYVNTDATLAVISGLQAIAFQWWRAESDGR
ncbi:MAG TPA: hypothetical protein VGQ33_00570 [Vicinamibacteria bacterium]|nr:hypothetical protein [Vicinamibacteria bacterium]